MKGIRITKSGKYQVTFDQGIINGVRHKSTKVFDTLGEAEKALTEFKYNKQRNLLVTVNNMSLVELLDYWMKKYVKYKCEETTRYGYNNIISKHIAPYFVDVELSKLQPMHVQDYYDHLMKVKGLSPNTVHKHHACIRKALDFGMKQQLVHRNVADAVELPKKEFFEGVSYSKEQLNELLQKVKGTKLEVPVYLASYLGLRREEISGLKWKNVDLEKRSISIVEVRTSAGKNVITKGPKTKESRRTIYIVDELLEVLLRQKVTQKRFKDILKSEYEDSDYVFTKDNGKPYRVNSVTEQFSKFLQQNNFPKIRLHDLRHSFASILYAEGLDLKAISEVLGHSNVGTTIKIYTHRFDIVHEKPAMAMSKALNLKNSNVV
ncbi:site-specific integrase [Paenibacillus nanensis]|uniref:Site-specific integrase n=2 Tax=Paenibacillus nanensis TaxID=393251 RepID=A0A3A1VJS8_9BACL|nr:site-specific integrase [Paenibacillus nanensis]